MNWKVVVQGNPNYATDSLPNEIRKPSSGESFKEKYPLEK